MRTAFLSLVLAIFATASSTDAQVSPAVGDRAPIVEPSGWFNAPAGFNAAHLEGKLVLVERWATWCAPCIAQIPHMNELHEKYAEKGLAIIGFSDEAQGTVEPVATEKMKYIVAFGGNARTFKTPGIPAAWLVAPDGNVVWQGNPSGLHGSIIEQHLSKVSVSPKFEFDGELEKAGKYLTQGNYKKGLKELAKVSAKTEDASVKAAAEDAREKVGQYAEKQMKLCESMAAGGSHTAALQRMQKLSKMFKGTEFGDKASDQYKAWKKDDAFKTEMKAESIIEAAKAKAKEKQLDYAIALLQKLIADEDYAGTKAKETAEKLLGRYQSQS